MVVCCLFHTWHIIQSSGTLIAVFCEYGVNNYCFLQAPDSKMKNTLAQISSPFVRLDVIGDSHFPLYQPSAEIS